ncbi:MAG: methyl-accepting chemotaxis protein [Ignavibacteriales bacterium]|nr:methyl-accepting chemotaxis protein [Ignavibacteriales bacterium]
MKWFMNQKLKSKLIISFLLVTLLTVCVGIAGIIKLQHLHENSTYLYENNTVTIGTILVISSEFQRQRANTLEAIIGAKDATAKAEAVKKIAARDETFEKALDVYEKQLTEDDEKKIFSDLKTDWSAYKTLRQQTIAIAENGTIEEAMLFFRGDVDLARKKVADLLLKMEDNEVAAAKAIAEANALEATNAIILMYIFIIVGIVMAVSIGLWLANYLSKGVKRVLQSMETLSNTDIANLGKGSEQLANGDLNIRIVTSATHLEVKSQDEIGELTENMNQIINKTHGTIVSVEKAVDAIKNIVGETKLLVDAAATGKLKTRGDANKFTGSYKELIVGLNETFDAIVKPLNESSAILEKMAAGDITDRISNDYPGDYSILKESINKFGEAMCDALHRVAEGVEATASASSQISSSTEEMAAGSQEQSSQTAEIASAVQQMTATILESTANVTRAADFAHKAGNIAKDGGTAVQETIKGMNRITKVVEDAARTVQELGASSEQIGQIVQVIDDIADQTNLLALNAAIEAARAGEQGRGFAVVADEVRKLAERTTKATKEIGGMIKQIQQNTGGAVKSMTLGTEEVKRGTLLANKAGSSLEEIISSVNSVISEINQVAATSEEQSSAAEQISKNIESISAVIHESASGTQQIARASEDLNKLTDNLQNLVSQFRITSQDSKQFSSRSDKQRFNKLHR